MIDPAGAGAPAFSGWSLVYEGFDPARERLREALCALGNGRFASRGAAPETEANEVHYPGTDAAGCYNRLTSEVVGREVEDESIVNVPNWLHSPFGSRAASGSTSPSSSPDTVRNRLAPGGAHPELRFRDAEGRETALQSAA